VPTEPETIGDLQERLNALDVQVRVLGIGEGGLIALGFGDLTANIAMAEDSPEEVIAVFITLVVIAGALLARAWIELHVAGRKVQTPGDKKAGEDWKRRDLEKDSDPQVQEAREMHRRGRRFLWSAITALVAAGGCYLLSAWLWALS
jgi:hypothetical protein